MNKALECKLLFNILLIQAMNTISRINLLLFTVHVPNVKSSEEYTVGIMQLLYVEVVQNISFASRLFFLPSASLSFLAYTSFENLL